PFLETRQQFMAFAYLMFKRRTGFRIPINLIKFLYELNCIFPFLRPEFYSQVFFLHDPGFYYCIIFIQPLGPENKKIICSKLLVLFKPLHQGGMIITDILQNFQFLSEIFLILM